MEPVAILNTIVWVFQDRSAFGAGLQGWSESAASMLIGSLWQGALFACGLALCMRLAPRIPARLRYAVWAAGFAALVCLPILPALVERLTSHALSAEPMRSFDLASASSSHPLLALDARWSLAIAALWLAASIIRAASLAGHAVRVRRLSNSASPISSNSLDASFQSVAARSAAPVELCVTSELDRPCVIGFFRPRILIPAWLLNRLTPAELEQVVLHESEHLRRWDNWANLVQKLCLVIFPLNPALWWLERRLCAERELACDDGVVGRTQAPRAYAACLAGLAERGLEHRNAALSLGAWQHRPELAERVHRLLRRPRTLSPAASAASVALVGCGLVAGMVALARCPQLVAFVAPAHQASNALSASAHMAAAQFIDGDVRTDWTRGSGPFAKVGVQPYRAVKTLAIMPAARSTSLPRNSNASPRSVSPAAADQAAHSDDAIMPGHSLASLVPIAVAAQMKAGQISQSAASPSTQREATQGEATQGEAAQTGWVVLTTFEEVQTSSSNGDGRFDATFAETHGANGTPGAKSSTRISVTRLVLRFEQPISNTQPASKAAPNSNSTQPVVIPYRDGWFVIQL